ncbi:MAG TPA: hypothetical protein DEO93_06755 [Stenotrophomonas sp.]|nr:hypothetical protein [Stenotrophomonas sp.]
MLSPDRLKRFLAADPANTELACALADLHFDAGRFADADLVLGGLPAAAQAAPGVQFRLARLALIVGDYAHAEQRLLQLRAAGHDEAAISHDLAFALLCQRRLDAALEIVDATVQLHGSSVELYVLKARIALMARQFAQASQHLDAALVLEPGHATALGLRALGLLDAGDLPAAGEAATQCLELHPCQHEALLAAGTLALWKREHRAADAHFASALAKFPNSGRALSGLGQVRMLDGDLEQAGRLLSHAVTTMPDHIGTWQALGWTQLLQGDIGDAEHSYRTALALDRNFAESHGGVAIVELLQGRAAEGELSMKRALKLDPHCISGRYARTLWLEQQGDAVQSNALFASLLDEGALPGVNGLDPQALASGLKSRILTQRGKR